jgi:hypothetical protein
MVFGGLRHVVLHYSPQSLGTNNQSFSSPQITLTPVSEWNIGRRKKPGERRWSLKFAPAPSKKSSTVLSERAAGGVFLV